MQAVINVYLFFENKAEAASQFYGEIFEGVTEFQRYKDLPEDQSANLNNQQCKQVMHAAVKLNDKQVLMLSDVVEGFCSEANKIGNNFSIALSVESEQQADELFKALSQGGSEKMPMQKTFWNAYFGMVTDQFGINWMINYDYG